MKNPMFVTWDFLFHLKIYGNNKSKIIITEDGK